MVSQLMLVNLILNFLGGNEKNYFPDSSNYFLSHIDLSHISIAFILVARLLNCNFHSLITNYFPILENFSNKL